MSALVTKLRRDLWHARAQVLSIAAVMAGGVASVVMMRGTAAALDDARAAYYADARFADAFATLTRAPDAVAARLRRVPGVVAVATRVVTAVRLDIPGFALPATARVVSLNAGTTRDAADDGALNAVRVIRGRAPAVGARDEVLVSGQFATANGFRPGDVLVAVVNARQVRWRMVGVGVAPDFLVAVAGAPTDARGFGIIWAPRALVAAVSGVRGGFNDVALGLAADARTPTALPAVLAAVDSVLAPYGGRGAVGRADQSSHRVVDNEIRQLRVMALAFPPVFVGVAAFLVATVLARVVATEREQIAILKAFGYADAVVARHYLAFAAAPVAVGALAGVALGAWLGRSFTALYTDVIRIPGLAFRAEWGSVAAAVAVLAAAALLGALGAVRGAAALAPAEALRPPAPARYRPLLIDWLGLGGRVGAAPRMVMRTIERNALRSLFGAVGVGAAVALVVAGLSLYDSIGQFMILQFRVGHRETLAVQFTAAVPAATARDALAGLPGVRAVELRRALPVRLRHAGRRRTLAVTGLAPGARMRHLVDVRGRTYALPPDGLVLSAGLARRLATRPGDTLDADLLERGITRRVVVAATLDEPTAPNAYATLAAVARLAGEAVGAPRADGADVLLDGPPDPALYARLRATPGVGSVTSRAALLAYNEQMTARSFRVTAAIVVGFAAVIALGVVYNGARIALSERGRELASLRVLGFTTREVGALLLGEQGLITLAGLPTGWVIGWAFAGALAGAFETAQYQMPRVVRAPTYALATAVVLAAATASGALMYRRTARLDLVAVLKTRE